MDKSEARTILGVDVNTSQEEIKKAYRILIKLYHPDKNPHLTNTEKKTYSRKYQQVQEAYETLHVIKQSNQQKNQDVFYKYRGETYDEFKKRKSKERQEQKRKGSLYQVILFLQIVLVIGIIVLFFLFLGTR